MTVPLSRRRAGARHGARLAEAAIDAELARQAAIDADRQATLKAERIAAREAEKARPKFTAADLAEATAVRDQYGWHKVVRVSAKSVTVETGYSWTDRISLDRVLDYAPTPPAPTHDT